MEIIYPPLVEQAYQFITKEGGITTKEEVYKMLVENDVLTETGEPTKTALKQGFVTEFHQSHETLNEFKREYPIFKQYPEEEFTQQDGIWYISQKIIREIPVILEKANYDSDVFEQIESYFGFRNYEDPHGSIAEMKGVYHPLYTLYEDDQFQVVDGSVAIPFSVLSDIICRCENGDLEVDEEMLFGLKEIVARMGE